MLFDLQPLAHTMQFSISRSLFESAKNLLLFVERRTYLRQRNDKMYINLWIERLVWEKVWMKAFTVFHV